MQGAVHTPPSHTSSPLQLPHEPPQPSSPQDFPVHEGVQPTQPSTVQMSLTVSGLSSLQLVPSGLSTQNSGSPTQSAKVPSGKEMHCAVEKRD